MDALLLGPAPRGGMWPLGETTPFEPPEAPALLPGTLRDGRYAGGNDNHRAELRVDAAGSGVLSADLFARQADGGQTWLASLRTRPGAPFEPQAGRWAIIATDRNEAVAEGMLALRPVGETAAQGELVLAAPLEGLPWGRPILLVLEWQSAALRRLGLEIEIEEGVEAPPTIQFNGGPMSIELALGRAGIETWAAGTPNALPKPAARRLGEDQAGWSEKDLETLMRDYAEITLDQPAFELHVLWLSRSNRRGLLGVMFDAEDSLQRQGLAIFASEIAGAVGPEHAPTKTIQTAVHEIGHALNLAHRFERVVGRADSTSFMNYDWRYKRGEHRAEYWRRFAFSFDEDELAFLRHGPQPALIPGGRAFHSVRYWAEGQGGYTPYLGTETPLSGLKLELLQPANGIALFDFGQPVVLGVRLTNTGPRAVRLPEFVLDPKAGFLEVTIQRLDLSDRDRRDVRTFTPILTRCFDMAASQIKALRPKETMEDNLNLVFGSSGFPFAEPGFYEVRAHLVFFDQLQDRELVASSAPLRIRVSPPASRQEERDTLDLFSSGVGRYLALGGVRSTKVDDLLQEVVARRTHAKEKDRGITDPVAVNIIRARAFRLNRDYHKREDGAVKVVARAKPERALAELARLDEASFKIFDEVTARSTLQFRSQLDERVKGPKKA